MMVEPSTLAPLWGIFGTAIGAIFGGLTVAITNEFIAWRRRPRLAIECNSDPVCDSLYLNEHQGVEEFWIRVHVTNNSHRTAKCVKLKLVQSRRGEDINNIPSWWFKVANLNTVSIDVPSKINEHFDIFYGKNIIYDENDIQGHLMIVCPPLKEWAELKGEIEKDNVNRTLDLDIQYELIVALTGENIDASKYIIEFKISKHEESMGYNKRQAIGKENFRSIVTVNIYPFHSAKLLNIK